MKRQQAANERNLARYRKATLPWREYLTPDELAILEAADKAKAEWQRLNASRAGIVNRAIQRAKFHAAREVCLQAIGGEDGS